MRGFKNSILAFAIAFLAVSCQSCKTKKEITPQPVVKSDGPTVLADPYGPAPKADTPSIKPSMLNIGPIALKPDYNFKNIQFEFNSAVLKTGSIQILDHVAAEMKKDTNVKFVLNGNSSAEGTELHNMELSIQRAAAVKTYLINSGIDGTNLNVKGFGESKPITTNATEAGKALNRRVEIKALSL